jgi:hypothetical protein
MKFIKFLFEEKENIIVKSPNKCTKKELNSFANLVNSGGQLSHKLNKDDIKEFGHLLSFYYENNKLLSVSALKIPNKEYKEKVFKEANAENLMNKYKYESGWSYTIPEARGKGLIVKLMEGLLKKTKNGVYATTRISNKAIEKVMEKMKFKKIGKNFPGMTEPIQVWINK